MFNSHSGEFTSFPNPDNKLVPVAEVLEKQFSNPAQMEGYFKLAEHDLHLAELYRHALIGNPETLNPFQATTEGGHIWVDVLAAIAPDVSLERVGGYFEIHSRSDIFVAGRVRAEALPLLAEIALQLEAATPIYPLLNRSVADIQADPATLQTHFPLAYDGSDVIVGIVDVGGCDLKHPNFRNSSDQSRILFLWDQGGTPQTAVEATRPFGREIDQNRLNQALQSADPYKNLGYTPADQAHGTSVMDVAAGSGQYPGVAPNADIIFVHLALPKPIDEEQSSLGNSKRLFDAVQYIWNKANALGKPAVINISLGNHGNAHNGISILEQDLDAHLQAHPNQAVVIGAGNSYHRNIHDRGVVRPNQPAIITWFIETHAQPNWNQRQEMEIWYDGQETLLVELFAPNGVPVGSCQLGETKQDDVLHNQLPIALLQHSPPSPGQTENHINLFLDDRYPGLMTGGWIIKLHLAQNTHTPVAYHAWVERNDDYPSHFDAALSEVDHTLNGIAHAANAIVVGAYENYPHPHQIAYFTGAGPSRHLLDLNKPDVSAPGFNVYAARATHSGGKIVSGTSMAAPHVTGVVALMLQRAREVGRDLLSEEIRDILRQTAVHNPPNTPPGQYDPRYGFGRVNATAALQQI